jgi:8-oxo-dGTP pyrophosphatase MutT (NUDIX family)
MLFNRIRSGVFIIKNNKILLFQRPAGYWYFPGGKVENNETSEQTAIRETKEETGLKVKIVKLLYVHELRRRCHRTLELIYLAKPIGGKFRIGIDPEENKRIVGLKYVPINSLGKIKFLFPGMISQLKKDIKNNFKNCPRDLGISRANLKKLLAK